MCRGLWSDRPGEEVGGREGGGGEGGREGGREGEREGGREDKIDAFTCPLHAPPTVCVRSLYCKSVERGATSLARTSSSHSRTFVAASSKGSQSTSPSLPGQTLTTISPSEYTYVGKFAVTEG